MKRGLSLLREPIAVGLALIVLFGVLRSLVAAASLLLFGFFSILLATLLSFPLDLFSRVLPRAAALLLTIAIVAGIIAGVGFLVVPVISAQVVWIAEQIPTAVARFDALWSGASDLVPQGDEIAGTLRRQITSTLGGLVTKAIPFALDAASALSLGVLLLVLAIFLAYQPDSYRTGLRALVPRDREEALDTAWDRLGAALRHWMGGILVSMVIMGTLTGLMLYIAGVKSWFSLGLLTFFGTFVPYAGAIASAVPGLAVGLAESPRRFLYALLVYVAVHVVEGYVVQPLIMKRAVELRPAALLFWQLFMTAVFGIPGVIVATPVLVCLDVAVEYFYIERTLGKRPPAPTED